MYVSFDNMPAESRIWIYQSDRKFSDEETINVEKKCKSFLEQWSSHGKDLKASLKIAYNHFIIIALDESFSQTSGCSIDSQVRFIKEVESDFNIKLLDKGMVAFFIDQEIKTFPLAEIRKLVETDQISGETLTFNNLIYRKKELEGSWVLPANTTWINRYFKSKSIV